MAKVEKQVMRMTIALLRAPADHCVERPEEVKIRSRDGSEER